MNNLVIVLASVAAVTFILVKNVMNAKAGRNSLEKQRIREIVDSAFPEGKSCQALYAQYVQTSSGGGATIARCYSYAVGFRPSRPDELWAIPLSINGKQITPSTPIRFCADNLEAVKGNSVWLKLYGPGPKAASNTTKNVVIDKDAFVLQISDGYVKSRSPSAFCPVNIQQKELWEDWKSFVGAMLERYS